MKDILYSPWRINYILSEKDDKCIFCVDPKTEKDSDHFIITRSKYSFVILNAYPYNNGHLMIVPNRHCSSLADLPEEEINDLFQLVTLTERVVRKAYNPDGINIGINLGKAAGAGIDDHLHVHLVPRWIGDVNFMTVIGGTRVIPEAFQKAYNQLKEQFDKVEEGK